MPTVQTVAYDPANPAHRARFGTMRTPYNESGEHLEDDDETQSDPDETGLDLLDETMLDEEGLHRPQNCKLSNVSTPQPHKLGNRKGEKLQLAMWDSDDEQEEYEKILARKKFAKAQKLRQREQQQKKVKPRQQESPGKIINHQSLSFDASHDTEVITNTSILPKRAEDTYLFDETQPWERELRAVESLEKDASPTPVPKHRRTTVDKVDTSFLESSQWQLPSQLPSQLTSQLTQSSQWRRQSRNSNTPNNNPSLSKNEKESWQEEAFRSSLEELLKTVPYSYFTSEGSGTIDNFWLGTCDESQHSKTSQQIASAQLHRQRIFDAASRSLSRLAIASRYVKPTIPTSDRDYIDEDSPDFSPPTPRTLPSFISVLNVIDTVENSGFGGGDSSFPQKKSKDMFCGRSVHGRNARTVYLSSDIINLEESNESESTNPFEYWSLEQMAIGAMKVAGQICHEAASDSNYGNTCHKKEEPLNRVAGFVAQNAEAGCVQKYSVPIALVESALGFLATCFACLESDIVYAVLRSPLQLINHETVFDAISYLTPNADIGIENSIGTVPMLALLTLSRGLEATHFVARYSTSIDPSSICNTCTSPFSLGRVAELCQQLNINFGVDDGGVGSLSGVGTNLGLSLESNERRKRLQKCAEYAFDYILDFDPVVQDNDVHLLYDGSDHCAGKDSKAHNSLHLGLKVETKTGSSSMASCRCPSVVEDRIFSSAAEYLSSMVQIGMVSTWLSQEDTEQTCKRTLEKLCQKLYSVIEYRARMQRSANQDITNECDNEAVCASALSLLILLLPRHLEEPTRHTSLSTSFRNMGDEHAVNISDLLKSPLMKKILSFALSWEDVSVEKSSSCTKYYAVNHAIHILCTITMAGASKFLEESAQKQLEAFVQRVTERICVLSEPDGEIDDSLYLASAITLLFHLHTGCPLLVRRCIRDCIGSTDNDQLRTSFVGGLISLCVSTSFAVASSASSLLRVLIEGSPTDRTGDVLSGMITGCLDTSDALFNTMDHALFAIQQIVTISNENRDRLPGLNCVCSLPRLCLLSDMMNACASSINFYRCVKLSLDDDADVINLFVHFLYPGGSKDCFDTLVNSTNISLLTLFARFAAKTIQFQNDDARTTFVALQQSVSDKLLCSSAISSLDTSMTQGSSIDLMQRALKFLHLIMSLHSDERYMARSLTRLTASMRRNEEEMRTNLDRSEKELMQLSSKYKQLEVECKHLTNALLDQRSSYERKLDLVRAEGQLKTRMNANVHARERKLAEEMALQHKRDLLVEHDKRISTQRDNERISKENEELKDEMSRDKLRIKELEEALIEEQTKSDKRNCDLSLAKEELQQTTTELQEVQMKLAASDDLVSSLTLSYEESQVKMEDTCSALVKIAAIHQRKEADTFKKEKQFHDAIEKLSVEADVAKKRYAKEVRRNESIKKELDEVMRELDEVKSYKAQQHRMKMNAPVSYLNSMHNQVNRDSRLKQKPNGRRGKENALDR